MQQRSTASLYAQRDLLSVLRVAIRLVDQTLQVHVAALELGIFQQGSQLLLELGESGPFRRVGGPTLGDHPEQFGPTMRRFVEPVALPYASHDFARAHRTVRGRTYEHGDLKNFITTVGTSTRLFRIQKLNTTIVLKVGI